MQPLLHVYKSSAGSGKTTRLAIEYIKLALSYPEAYRHIIALTFTNKAAQEMKERILRFLSEIVDMKQQPPYFTDDILQGVERYANLLDTNKPKAIQCLQKDAKTLFRQILHHYSDYAVSTLDSFTNRIIRSFSHDLGISFNYQVELDTDELLKMSVDELINHVNADEKELNKVLTTFSRSKIDDEKSQSIALDLQQRAKSLLNDVEEPYLHSLRQQDLTTLFQAYPKLKKAMQLHEKTLAQFGQQFLDVCSTNGIEANMFYQGTRSIYPYFKRIAEGNIEKLEPNAYVTKIIDEGKWTTNKTYLPLLESVSAQMLDIYKQMQAYITQAHGNYLLKKEVLTHFFPYLVLMELEKVLDKIKAENELLHISDFNKIISSQIANESSPYIYERIGNRYHHFLLDEFQDTSAIQWSNLIPLIENALSENYYNLIVGDAKQSIYRFRGGDVEQFVQLPALPNDQNIALRQIRENIFSHVYQEHILDTNYRSAQTIIAFNNKFFAHLLQQLPLPENIQKVYAEVTQKAVQKDNAFVEITRIEATKRKKQEVATDYKKHTLSIIQECKTNGYAYKDIAVLCRNNDDIKDLSVLLLDHNIPFVSSESLEIQHFDAIPFVLHFIRYLQYDTEALYQLQLLRYLHQHDYFDKDLTFAALLEQVDPKQALINIWDDLQIEIDKSKLLGLDAYEGIEALARLFKLPTEHPFFHFFLEAAFQFSREHHQGLIAFPEWWEKRSKDFKLELPEDQDAVRLMTFHKAKGLEFPIVINWLSDTFEKAGMGDTIWLNPELEDVPEIESFPFKLNKLKDTKFASVLKREESLKVLDKLNLLYVALTRPVAGMYILCEYTKASKTKKEADFSLHYAHVVDSFLHAHYAEQIEKKTICIGNKQAVQTRTVATKDKGIALLPNTNTSAWQQQIDLQVEAEKMWQLSMPIQEGIKIHRLLAAIYTADDIDKALDNMLYQSLIESDEYDVLKQNLQQIVEHPQLKDYYAKGVKAFNEVELSTPQGVIFRPDRLVLQPQHCVVIDYKTGAERPEHQQQLQNYMELAATFTQKPSQGLLVYINKEIKVKAISGVD